jgi:hypothetical protein
MSSRRSNYDPLAACDRPRWLVTLSMCREPLSTREIAPGADLRAVMRDAQAAMLADDWQPECDGRHGFFFARRGDDRVEVGLQTIPPGSPRYGRSILGAGVPSASAQNSSNESL